MRSRRVCGKPQVLRNWAACLALLLLLFLSGVGGAQAGEGGEEGLRKVRLQLKWLHQFQFAGYYAAIERGYYRDVGLEVELLEPREDEDPAEAVLNGRAEFGVGTSELVLLRARGHPIVLLAPIFQHSPLVFLARAGPEIGSIHDLAGKRVAVERQAAELLAYLQYEGLPPGSIQRVPHPFHPGPLIEGEIDAISAYSTDEPFLLREAGVDYLVFNPRAGGIDFYGDSLFTRQQLADEEPQLVRDFLEASIRGWRHAMANKEDIVDLIYTEYSQRHSREHLLFEARESERLILPDIVEFGYINEGRWRFIAETYVELGLLDRVPSLDGFFFERYPERDFSGLYRAVAILLLLLLVVGTITLRFYHLNQRLARQIAERERAEAELRKAEERYRVLVEDAPFPIAITDRAEGHIRFLNPQAERVLRLDRKTSVGMPARNLYADPSQRDQLIGQVNRFGHVDDMEIRLRRGDGSAFHALLYATIIEFEGRPCYFAACTDITARKEAEEQLRRNHEELQAITASLPALIARVDRDLRCQFANYTFERWIGISSQRLIGQDIAAVLSPGAEELLSGQLRRCFDARSAPVQIECDVPTLGGVRVMAINVVPHREGDEVTSLFLVATDVTASKRQELELRKKATFDALTGLLNRGECFAIAERILEQCRAAGSPLCAVMIDLDHFKEINDTHGHDAGDQVLRAFGQALNSIIREDDVAGRIGGEEFLLVLPRMSLRTTTALAERIREMTSALKIPINGESITVSASMGIAQIHGEKESLGDLVKQADAALYTSKDAGRNRVSVWGADE